MKSNKLAIDSWNQLPGTLRIKILNTVYCVNCSKTVSLVEPIFEESNINVLIKGHCLECGSDVCRVVEDVIKDYKKKDNFGNQIFFDFKKVEKLVAFSRNHKFRAVLDSIPPLKIEPVGEWDPKEQEYLTDTEEYNIDSTVYADVIALGVRTCWEIEEKISEEEVDEFDCPIIRGLDITREHGDEAGIKYFINLIEKEPRYIDAYVHLGNIYYHKETLSGLDKAKSYYKQAVAIGLLSIGDKVGDVFLWSFIYNRPFLRALHGFGLCLLDQGKVDDALHIFSYMILLNPDDNQGVRMIISDYM